MQIRSTQVFQSETMHDRHLQTPFLFTLKIWTDLRAVGKNNVQSTYLTQNATKPGGYLGQGVRHIGDFWFEEIQSKTIFKGLYGQVQQGCQKFWAEALCSN